MMELLLTEDARQDLEDIFAYYNDKSPKVAVSIFNSIIDEINLLAKYPHAAPVEFLSKSRKYEARSLTVISGLFKAIYFIDEPKNMVIITQIFPCRQSPDKMK
ncbi:MAG: type II toxin-antitoxin system RelE/ParE family toxin [Alistipes sp.]|nr:type II toxin-antitoxin system RelE/ParE family toxin [Alistipes sp.]